MRILSDEQVAVALKALNMYLSAAPNPETGLTPVASSKDLDAKRQALINEPLSPMVASFLSETLSLSDFKTQIDRINKRNELWGFKGIKGQMFFNLLYNGCVDEAELAAELRAAIAVPDNDDIAKSRIRNFSSYARRIGETIEAAGGSKQSRPKPSSVPFFLSYFWQILQPSVWPVYYTNSVQVLADLNLFQPADDLADSYEVYKALHIELQAIFSAEAKKPFTLYDVEHVWWYLNSQKHSVTAEVVPAPANMQATVLPQPQSTVTQLPDSYVPPIVAIIPRLAANDPALEAAAKASGISIARALEKNVHVAFTMLGYETQLLGQGQGRVQDGLALSRDYSYAVIWDAKARQNGYSMGTDDRTIREYITTQSRELKKRLHLRNLYYVIISSKFQDDFDELIRGIKMETDISEVCLLESDVLLAMVEAKLRDPNQISLGPDGLQRVFCRSGIIMADDVKNDLV
ncbi:hypothetical protein [Herbaspirillum aquaticum]|uniref:FokI cleavage domain-containing protein n=1 Tax=Herbaspirillum aquaticum TaxID=568783 RepID=A0A225SSA5_9BURK|nr:hypothetical protein [Herbaspirillum aquaticum]OWY33954.1 hypothetical protein CEJ45_15110 [Herbaspirillum aquaticum]